MLIINTPLRDSIAVAEPVSVVGLIFLVHTSTVTII